MKHVNSRGIGAAHRGLFDRSTMHCAPEGDGGGGAAPPSLEQRMTAMMERLEAKLAPAPAPAAPVEPAAPAAPDLAARMASLEALAAKLDPRPPAAAPAAPSAHSLPTANGVLDLFAMTPTQHQQLGPAKVRETLEQLWKIGEQASGRPERPQVPVKGKA